MHDLARPTPLLTVGHGTLGADDLAALLRGAGVGLVVDVRIAPGSRRMPHVARDELERWLPGAGIAYRWARDLGGFRRAAPDSPDVALRNASFRGYAGHMRSVEFGAALGGVLADAARTTVAVMCAETLWWRCHRRLIADAATLLHGAEVRHVGHDGRLSAHRPTDGARVDSDGRLVYDGGAPTLPLPG